MCSLPPRSLAAALALTVALFSAAGADDVRVQVDEDLAPEHPIADLCSRLALTAGGQLRLVDEDRSRFRVDDAGWLTLSVNSRLDFETESTHRLVVEVRSRRTEDSLRDRFASLVASAGIDRDEVDELHYTSRLVSIEVQVNDRPERPRLVPQLMQLSSGSAQSGIWVCGRAVAVDDDRGDALRYELIDGSDWFRIDPATGTIWLRNAAALPAVSTMTFCVAVTDSSGLTDRRNYVVRLIPHKNSAPRRKLPVLPSEPLPGDIPSFAIERSTPPVVAAPGSDIARPADVAAAVDSGADNPASRLSNSTAGAADLSEMHETLASSDVGKDGTTVTPDVRPTARTPANDRDAIAAASLPAGSLAGRKSSTVGPAAEDSSITVEASMIRVFGWFVWSFVSAGLIIIISSAMRAANAVRARRPERDRIADHINPAASLPHGPAPTYARPTAARETFRAPPEIEDLLARLSGSIGEERADFVTDQVGAIDRTHLDAGPGSVDDLMSRVLTSAGLMAERHKSEGVTTATVLEPPQVLAVAAPASVNVGMSLLTEDFPTREHLEETPTRQPTDALILSERECLEELRSISRRFNREEISRHQKEIMCDEWKSLGMAALGCLITGSVCLATRCFAETSLPVGLALIAVSIALLMRRSLYPPVPQRGATAPSNGSALR